ncbi:MAG: putative N6-adenine-specific DNA methylase [Flavobacteriales bacterium]|jgi:putative N6-adenine-specific DNA methylase
MKMTAKTLKGLEKIVAEELKEIGASNIEILKRAVSFEGDKSILYKANLHLRCAIAVLTPIYEFKAKDEFQLYDKMKEFDWSQHLSNDTTFSFNSSVHSEYFDHSMYVSLKCKDAIVDQFRAKTGERPSIDRDNPDIAFNIHLTQDQVRISLDSSGKSLNKRGYRNKSFDAPLNECLAAGMIKLTGWHGEKSFVDPMCGSGTLLIEAALIATKTAPGLLRAKPDGYGFAFQKWKDYDQELFDKLVEEAMNNVVRSEIEILGFDADIYAIDLSKMSSIDMGFNFLIKIEKKGFAEMECNQLKDYIIVMNPPYNERLELEQVEKFYGMIGSTLKHKHMGAQAWIITSNIDGMKSIGLKTSRRFHLMNGSLECKFHGYDLYDGSKKAKKQKKVVKKHRVKSDGSIESA